MSLWKNLAGLAIAGLTSLVPKRDLVVMASHDGFSGNARAFYEALERAGFPFGEVVWLTVYPRQKAALDARSIRSAPAQSLAALWAAARARWLVSTHGELGRTKCLWGQGYVNLWHGSGMKAAGYLWNKPDGDMNAQTVGRADITLVTSELMRVVWSSICRMSALKVFAAGYPRNDVFHATETARDQLIELLDGANYSGIVLYAPTHRKVVARSETVQETTWTFEHFVDKYIGTELMEVLERRNILLVVKLHPMGEALFVHLENRLPENVRLITNDELNERGVEFYDVLAGFDMMWTDYSSMSTDFLITGKPVLIFTDDLPAYRKGRGIIFDNFDFFTPGPKVDNLETLLDEFERLLSDPLYFAEDRRRFLRNFHTAPTPYSRNVIELMRAAPEDRADRLAELTNEQHGAAQ